MRKLNIIYLHQYFNTRAMSGGTRSYEMARRLVSMGHRVTMITSWRVQDGRRDWFVTNEEGIEVHWLPVPYSNNMPYHARIRAFFRFAFLSSLRAASVGGDIVFATSTPLTISIPGVFVSKKLKVPMVFEVRDLWPELPIAVGALKNSVVKKIARYLEYWAYRNSEAIVALSPGMREGIIQSGYPPDRVAVVPNSSDIFDFVTHPNASNVMRSMRTWLGDRPLITYPGTFGRINGVGYMVNLAAALLKTAPEVRILLVGDGMERESVKEAAKRAGVFEVNLFIENAVPKKEIPAILAGSDMICSLFVDIKEMQANSANKFFDTLAAGKPILLNYGGWQADLVGGWGCGLVIWRMKTDEAAFLIAKHLSDRSWLAHAGEQSKKMASQLFDRDKLASQLAEILAVAAERRGDIVNSIAPGNY